MGDDGEITLVLNPSANSEKAKKVVDKIRDLSPRIRVCESRSFEAAAALAREAVASDARALLAAGGDGTINAVISGLAGSETALGVFPTGTMNLFARELKLPMHNLKKCWEIVEAGETREVDLFTANGQVFVQLAGVGFDAQIIEETTWENKKKFGPLSYVMSAFSVAGKEPPVLRVEAMTGKTAEGAFALVGNGSLYGPRFKMFRNASNQDRVLDVLVFKKQSYVDIVRYVSGLTLGQLENMKDVTYIQTPELRVECDKDVPVEVDGELAGTTPVDFRPLGRRLRVFAPPAVEEA